jgi:hypothetical protein
MIPNAPVLRRPSRGIVLLTKIKGRATTLGSRTMAFFRKGEELEATEYENLPHDDPTLVPPKLGFRNFDSVPRNRAPLVITIVLIAVAALSLLRWRSVGKLVGETPGAAASELRK